MEVATIESQPIGNLKRSTKASDAQVVDLMIEGRAGSRGFLSVPPSRKNWDNDGFTELWG